MRIILDAYAASFAQETPWHHSQHLIARSLGRFDLTLCFNGLQNARIEVLCWGQHPEVLSPEQLRADVQAELQAALKHYP